MSKEIVVVNDKEYEIGYKADIISANILGKIIGEPVAYVLGYEHEDEKNQHFFFYITETGKFQQWQSINDIAVKAKEMMAMKNDVVLSVSTFQSAGKLQALCTFGDLGSKFIANNEAVTVFDAVEHFYLYSTLEFKMTEHIDENKLALIRDVCDSVISDFKSIEFDMGKIIITWSKPDKDIARLRDGIQVILDEEIDDVHEDFRIEKQWKTMDGYDAIVIISIHGRRSGYVEIPKNINPELIDKSFAVSYSGVGTGYPGVEVKDARYVGFTHNSVFVKPDREAVDRIFGENMFIGSTHIPDKGCFTLEDCFVQAEAISMNIAMLDKKFKGINTPDTFVSQYTNIVSDMIEADSILEPIAFSYNSNYRYENIFPTLTKEFESNTGQIGFSRLVKYCLTDAKFDEAIDISEHEVRELYKLTSTPPQFLPPVDLNHKVLIVEFKTGKRLYFNIQKD